MSAKCKIFSDQMTYVTSFGTIYIKLRNLEKECHSTQLSDIHRTEMFNSENHEKKSFLVFQNE
jgi:spore coat protein CotF